MVGASALRSVRCWSREPVSSYNREALAPDRAPAPAPKVRSWRRSRWRTHSSSSTATR
jgi:hypothetical protein